MGAMCPRRFWESGASARLPMVLKSSAWLMRDAGGRAGHVCRIRRNLQQGHVNGPFSPRAYSAFDPKSSRAGRGRGSRSELRRLDHVALRQLEQESFRGDARRRRQPKPAFQAASTDLSRIRSLRA